MSRIDLLPEGKTVLLDRYQLVGEIATGGMATVFLARLAGVGGFQRFFAIKRLHPHLAKEQEFVEMFLDEARLAASINHQNVVPILEIGTSHMGYYLVMEYVEGVTLARLIAQATAKQEPVARPILLRIMLDCLSGLHAAHELTDETGKLLGLVHRDCSPQNLLVGIDGCSKLTDFGVARASSRLATTRSGATKGKLAYMAPEQLAGDRVDRRADLFAVGVMLWEVLATRRLFKGKSDAHTVAQVMQGEIPRLSDYVEVHPALEQVCEKALERDCTRRYQTAAEFADALEKAALQARAPDDPDQPAIASVRKVAAHMRAVYGEDLALQRDRIREWLAATPSGLEGEHSRPVVASSVGRVVDGRWVPAGELPVGSDQVVTGAYPDVTLDDDVDTAIRRPTADDEPTKSATPPPIPTTARSGGGAPRRGLWWGLAGGGLVVAAVIVVTLRWLSGGAGATAPAAETESRSPATGGAPAAEPAPSASGAALGSASAFGSASATASAAVAAASSQPGPARPSWQTTPRTAPAASQTSKATVGPADDLANPYR